MGNGDGNENFGNIDRENGNFGNSENRDGNQNFGNVDGKTGNSGNREWKHGEKAKNGNGNRKGKWGMGIPRKIPASKAPNPAQNL